MVKINLQIVTLFLLAFIIVLYMVDLWIPIFWVGVFKSVLYFIFASTIVAQALGLIFDRDDEKKKRKKRKG